MPETTPLIKAALNLRGGAGFDVYEILNFSVKVDWCLEGICKVLHENVKGLQFPKTHNNF